MIIRAMHRKMIYQLTQQRQARWAIILKTKQNDLELWKVKIEISVPNNLIEDWKFKRSSVDII